jgi:hypothetical protein
MLGFMAEHRMVLERQVIALLGGAGAASPVQGRLRRLAAAGYLAQWCVFERSRCCQIRSRGLAAIGCRLRPPDLNLGAYRHDVGTAWLWLAAHRGAFGPLAEVIAERRLRSHDMAAPATPYSIRLGGYDAHGRPRRHYPDLLLIDPRGRRLALELELSSKSKARLEEILAGYGSDRRVDGVVYLVEDSSTGRGIGRAVTAGAARMGISERVHVRPVAPITVGSEESGRSGGSRGDGRTARSTGRGREPAAAEATR